MGGNNGENRPENATNLDAVGTCEAGASPSQSPLARSYELGTHRGPLFVRKRVQTRLRSCLASLVSVPIFLRAFLHEPVG